MAKGKNITNKDRDYSKDEEKLMVKYTITVYKDIVVESKFTPIFNGRKEVKHGTYEYKFNINQIDKERNVQSMAKQYGGNVIKLNISAYLAS